MVQRPSDALGALRLIFAVAALAMAGCGNSTQEIPRHATSTPTDAKRPTSVPDFRPHIATASWDDRQAQTDILLVWYATARDDPDPMARLQIIESWAQQAQRDSSLDLLTNALVDPDQTVRARAQELFEQELARR
jgi:hypothetical protein